MNLEDLSIPALRNRYRTLRQWRLNATLRHAATSDLDVEHRCDIAIARLTRMMCAVRWELNFRRAPIIWHDASSIDERAAAE